MIFDVDGWQEIFGSLRRHKLRAVLTAFGVFWGIFMLINLMGVGKGLENGMSAQFGQLTNAVYLWSGRPTSIPYKGLTKGRFVRLDDDDMEALRTQISDIQSIAPNNGMGSQLAIRGIKSDSFELTGIVPVSQKAKGYILDAGRFLNNLDMKYQRKNIVIGKRVREVLFQKDENPIGELITIRSIQFRVVGVISPSATSGWAERDLSKIFVPFTTLRKTFNQKDRVHSALIVPKPGVDAFSVEDQVIELLYKRNKVHPDDKGVVGSYNVQRDYNRMQDLFSGINIFSWVVAIGTIIAGVIGVGNIMLISVKERTKEIGIRKAIGATPSGIVGSILKESLLITFIAGYAGLVAGVLSVELISKVASKGDGSVFLNPEVSFSTAFVAILVLLISGALASFLPARKAAMVDPVIALQDE